MEEYKPELIEMVLNKLKPEFMTYAVVSKRFEGKDGNLKEKWYGTEYTVDRMDKTFLERLESTCLSCVDLKLPSKNEFIPNNFDLKPRETDEKAPEIIR